MKRPTDLQLEAFDRTQSMSLSELRGEFEKLKDQKFKVAFGGVEFQAEILRVTHVECLTDTGKDHVRLRLQATLPWIKAVHAMHYALQGMYDDIAHHRTFSEPKSGFDQFNFGRSISTTYSSDDRVEWVFELEFF
jgi:hypothetical protein|uniref:Uncharacterized protein n=1 Tax=Myoviridae sp. ctshb19 TaxID=2825194 RepID=A0A8S5UGV5_9CAUD|nr:MAG TPA: hypothetical protein [Myoviridae sp. ctshb19]